MKSATQMAKIATSAVSPESMDSFPKLFVVANDSIGDLSTWKCPNPTPSYPSGAVTRTVRPRLTSHGRMSSTTPSMHRPQSRCCRNPRTKPTRSPARLLWDQSRPGSRHPVSGSRSCGTWHSVQSGRSACTAGTNAVPLSTLRLALRSILIRPRFNQRLAFDCFVRCQSWRFPVTVRVQRRIPIGLTGFSLKVLWFCPIRHLPRVFEAPARLILSVDDTDHYGVRLVTNGIEVAGNRIFKPPIGKSAVLMGSAHLKFPSTMDFGSDQWGHTWGEEFAIKLGRTALKMRF